jgi:hypothetical protein
MSAALDAALSYAAKGWRVIRLHYLTRDRAGTVTGCSCKGQTAKHNKQTDQWEYSPNDCSKPGSNTWGKHPRGAAWQKKATTDPGAIRALWTERPRDQVGIACGPESDLWVLDVDGATGADQLAALVATHGPLPPTWTVQTGSGGQQLYFRWPLCGRKPSNRAKMVKAGAPTVGEGLDARGDGGQVVAPPSENRRGTYRVVCDDAPTYAPGWLLDLVCPPPPAPRPATPPPTIGATGEGLRKRLTGLLAQLCRKVAAAPQGARNSTLNDAAHYLARRQAAHPDAIALDEIRAALRSAAEGTGMASGEIEATLTSAILAGQATPVPLADRTAPPRPQRAQQSRRAAPDADPAPDAPEPEAGQEGAAQAAGGAPPKPPPRPALDGLPEGWRDPAGWILDAGGVWEITGTGKRERETQRAVAPIWISGRRRDHDSGAISLEVAWRGGRSTLRRAAALSHRELVMLADQGAPISSQSAADIVRWLEAAEVANEAVLPVRTEIGRLGWTTTDDGAPALQGAEGPHLLRLGDGLARLQSAIQPGGTWAAWLDAAQEVHAESPVAALLLAASVGSVLLPQLDAGAAPFVVDLHGLSTTGKTTALRWACSGWAAPQDGAGGMIGWDTSPTAIEGRAGALRHWPLMIDDTKKLRPRDREAMAGLVYNWSAGQGRGRGDVEGRARAVATWRSVMLSTGEQRLSGLLGGQHAGAQMRMLPISAEPFPARSAAVARIEGLNSWGHLPARVGARIVEAGQAALRARWAEERARIERALGTDARASRLAAIGATVMLGADILADVGVWASDGPEIARIERVLLAGLRDTQAGADLAAESWARICAWLAGARDRLSDQSGQEGRIAPAGGWIGRVVEDRVAVQPAIIEAELRRLGFEPGEVVGQWERRGWLIPGRDGARTQVIRWGGQRSRLWVLAVGAGIEAAADDDDLDGAHAAH